MQLDGMQAMQTAPNSTAARRRSMIVTPDRIVYSGLLGSPSHRMHGAHTVYIAHENPFQIAIDGGPAQSAWLAVVPASEVHVITSPDRLIRDILIEPETAEVRHFAAFDRRSDAVRGGDYAFIDRAFETWLAGRSFAGAGAAELDEFFFGAVRPYRAIDERIERVVARIRAQPCEQFSAAECARLTGLSFSRFVHLFKQEIGMTFRAFCAWKRARSVLPSMTDPCNLTNLALEAGYPDSTHFSHSIRRIFGLRPRDILAGTRHLSVLCAANDRPDWLAAAPSPAARPARASVATT